MKRVPLPLATTRRRPRPATLLLRERIAASETPRAVRVHLAMSSARKYFVVRHTRLATMSLRAEVQP